MCTKKNSVTASVLGRKIIIIIEKLFWFPFSHLLPFWQGCDLLLSCEKCSWQVRCSRGRLEGWGLHGELWRAGREGTWGSFSPRSQSSPISTEGVGTTGDTGAPRLVEQSCSVPQLCHHVVTLPPFAAASLSLLFLNTSHGCWTGASFRETWLFGSHSAMSRAKPGLVGFPFLISNFSLFALITSRLCSKCLCFHWIILRSVCCMWTRGNCKTRWGKWKEPGAWIVMPEISSLKLQQRSSNAFWIGHLSAETCTCPGSHREWLGWQWGCWFGFIIFRP